MTRSALRACTRPLSWGLPATSSTKRLPQGPTPAGGRELCCGELACDRRSTRESTKLSTFPYKTAHMQTIRIIFQRMIQPSANSAGGGHSARRRRHGNTKQPPVPSQLLRQSRRNWQARTSTQRGALRHTMPSTDDSDTGVARPLRHSSRAVISHLARVDTAAGTTHGSCVARA